jgi:tagatose-1,6-bisphosphate aldolase non-catalytic subunit AgaZ/GatZ
MKFAASIAWSTVLLLSLATDARSTQTYCAVVKPTSDGFVALRAGPGIKFSIRERLQPFEWTQGGAEKIYVTKVVPGCL